MNDAGYELLMIVLIVPAAAECEMLKGPHYAISRSKGNWLSGLAGLLGPMSLEGIVIEDSLVQKIIRIFKHPTTNQIVALGNVAATVVVDRSNGRAVSVRPIIQSPVVI